jgi:hypothetical protein
VKTDGKTMSESHADSIGYPARCQAISPPLSAATSRKPLSCTVAATRAADFSSGQVQ